MPAFAFWNTYRLGGGSGEAKRIIIEGVLAQIFDSHQAEFAILCEVTGDVQLGDAPVQPPTLHSVEEARPVSVFRI